MLDKKNWLRIFKYRLEESCKHLKNMRETPKTLEGQFKFSEIQGPFY
jgi:hypothetical protein